MILLGHQSAFRQEIEALTRTELADSGVGIAEAGRVMPETDGGLVEGFAFLMYFCFRFHQLARLCRLERRFAAFLRRKAKFCNGERTVPLV